MDLEKLLHHLHRQGWVRSANASAQPLSGGVSCDILLINDGQTRFVLKQALPKLRVKDDWFADVSRNHYEQQYMKYVGKFLPDAVPRILHSDAELGFFTMEYLGEGYANWKSLMLAGQAEPAHARRAGEILGTIHRRSWNDPEARAGFDTTQNFFQLRADAYLLTTGKRHPKLQPFFDAEAARVLETRLCLVHGDYSPKNILIGPDGRVIVLDCEVAWFGDPAFDVSFFLNHFMLKALHHHADPQPFLDLAHTAWDSYSRALDNDHLPKLETHVARLLPMLMLARVDGKSPVEYLTDDRKKNLIRAFVTELLPRPPAPLMKLIESWGKSIHSL